MALIETKFDMGDTVYFANIATEARQHPCPDCLGSKEWLCTSPAGGEFKTSCPRCSDSYKSNRALDLGYAWWTPSVQRLTIGLVQANAGGDRGHQYMCHETGVGSGSVYYESNLFATEDEARADGEAKAAAHNNDAKGWVAQQYAGSLKFCDYELKDAALQAAEARAREASYLAEYLIEDLRGASGMDEVKSIIDRRLQVEEPA